MDVPAPPAQQIVWDITEDLIDADHLAQACTKVQIRIKDQGVWKRHRKLWIIGAVALVFDVIIGVLWSPWVIGVLVAYVVVVIVVARLWNRWVASQSARHLRDHPLTFPAGIVTATPEGLHQAGADGASTHTWRVYESVWAQDDLIVVVRTPNLMIPLPNAALAPERSPDAALKLLRWWIAAAHAGERTQPGAKMTNDS